MNKNRLAFQRQNLIKTTMSRHKTDTLISTITLLISLLITLTESSVVYLYHNCPNTTTFTPNTTYQTNLNTLLSTFSNSSLTTTFSNLTINHTVFGLYLCRGDVTKQTCHECITSSISNLLQICPNQKVSFIAYDECMLRYSNTNFFSTVDKEPSLQLLNTQTISEPERFMELLMSTMNNISSMAAESDMRFATTEAWFSRFQTLYSLAQCTRDLDVEDCRECLRDAVGYLPSCCNGKQGGRVIFASCTVRYELYPFYKVNESAILEPGPSQRSGSGKKRMSKAVIIAVVAPIAACAVLLALGLWFLSRRRRKTYKSVSQRAGDESSEVDSLQLDLASIKTATDNFSAKNLLGEGGFGIVYKGTLPNGQVVAVKRLLSTKSWQGEEEFKNEVGLAAKLQHRNLVRLLGYCLEADEKILVYEYVPNKSLDHYLFDSSRKGLLTWARRYKIIEGIAKGIMYLHEDSRLRIIHRDLKASNTLLDEYMNPKISDFSIARVVAVDQTKGKTDIVVGTFGYMAPEYAIHGQFSLKSDIYSYGVLVLEIITGKKSSSLQTENTDDLLNYVWKLWNNNTPLEMLDPIMEDVYSTEEVIRCIHIGLLCVQENPAERPSIGTILLMLNSRSVSVPSPLSPALLVHSQMKSSDSTVAENESDQSMNKSVPFSANEASITELYPR